MPGNWLKASIKFETGSASGCIVKETRRQAHPAGDVAPHAFLTLFDLRQRIVDYRQQQIFRQHLHVVRVDDFRLIVML